MLSIEELERLTLSYIDGTCPGEIWVDAVEESGLFAADGDDCFLRRFREDAVIVSLAKGWRETSWYVRQVMLRCLKHQSLSLAPQSAEDNNSL